jgi:hypothetical protein
MQKLGAKPHIVKGEQTEDDSLGAGMLTAENGGL